VPLLIFATGAFIWFEWRRRILFNKFQTGGWAEKALFLIYVLSAIGGAAAAIQVALNGH
jgi:hypothetical protein